MRAISGSGTSAPRNRAMASPGARRIVMRVARAPNDFFGKILRQFLDRPFLGIKAEHDVAVLPHLLGLGTDRIMMQ